MSFAAVTRRWTDIVESNAAFTASITSKECSRDSQGIARTSSKSSSSASPRRPKWVSQASQPCSTHIRIRALTRQLSLVLLQIHKYEGSRFIDALSHLRNFGDCDIEQKSELASWMASFADFLTDKFLLLPRKMISLRGKSDADHL